MVFVRLVESFEQLVRNCEKLTVDELSSEVLDDTLKMADAQKATLRAISFQGISDPAFSRVLVEARNTILAEWNQVAERLDRLDRSNPKRLPRNFFSDGYVNAGMGLRRAARTLGLGRSEAAGIVRQYLEYCREEQGESLLGREEWPTGRSHGISTEPGPDGHKPLTEQQQQRLKRLLAVMDTILGPDHESVSTGTATTASSHSL
ncbi:MAG TPA: hypothetical protein EYP56_07625 [Planctomycetaceae bacterium]|nr:hypothetical protein [Planctomycetaceae bacterium]